MEQDKTVEIIITELAKWDDEFDSPKWAASTRRRMAEAIAGSLADYEHWVRTS
jgi:hypothetical protein